MPSKRLLVATALAAVALPSTSCTLTKPIVCAVTTPAIVLGNTSSFCGCSCDGEAALCAIGVIAVVGAVGGLVTGVISDINILAGRAEDPVRNLGNPFGTNTSAETW